MIKNGIISDEKGKQGQPNEEIIQYAITRVRKENLENFP